MKVIPFGTKKNIYYTSNLVNSYSNGGLNITIEGFFD